MCLGMDAFETIIYEKRGGTAYVTLNRPQVLNCYNTKMRDEMYQVLSAIRDDPEADISEFGTAPSPVIARQVRWERDVWGLFLSLRQPLIAAIQGYCLGSGVEIACFCDVRIASEEAIFGLPEVGLGMIPAAGGTQTLPRTIGRGKALEILLTGEYIDAREAYRIGLVNMVALREELYPEAERMAQKIISRDPVAVRYAKEAINRGLDLSLEEGLALERKLAALVVRTGTSRRG